MNWLYLTSFLSIFFKKIFTINEKSILQINRSIYELLIQALNYILNIYVILIFHFDDDAFLEYGIGNVFSNLSISPDEYYFNYFVDYECHDFKKKFQKNYSDEYLCLGNMFFEAKDYYKAMHYYLKSSESIENSVAIFQIGFLYANGLGVKQNYLKAKEYYEQSAQMNNSEALFILGILYENGQGVDKNYSKAIEYYKQSAREYNSDALFKLGTIFMGLSNNEEKLIKPNYKKAQQYFELSAYNYNPDGLYHVGHFYLDGEIFDIYLWKAIIYFKESIQIHKKTIKISNMNKIIYNNYY